MENLFHLLLYILIILITELERAIQLTTNWTVIVVMLSTCCPVRFVMCSTLGQQQQNLGLVSQS